MAANGHDAHTKMLDDLAERVIAERAARRSQQVDVLGREDDQPPPGAAPEGEPPPPSEVPPTGSAPAEVVEPPPVAPDPAAPPAAEPPPADPAVQVRLDLIAKKTKEAEDLISARARELDAKIEEARPILEILGKLGPGAAQYIETAQKIGDLQAMAKSDPLGVMLALGADVNLVAKQALEAQLGDNAPPQIKAALAQHKASVTTQTTDAKIAALEAKIADLIEATHSGQKRETYRKEISTALAGAGDDLAILRAHAADPTQAQRLLDGLVAVQEAHARATGAAKPVAELLVEMEDELAKDYTADYIDYLRKKNHKAPPAASQAGTRPETAASQAAPTKVGITNKVGGGTPPPPDPGRPKTRAELVAEAKQYLEDRAKERRA